MGTHRLIGFKTVLKVICSVLVSLRGQLYDIMNIIV